MPSSKGKPTDPKLREEVKESTSRAHSDYLVYNCTCTDFIVRLAEVKNEANKDGSGKGQWSAWKVNTCFLISTIVFNSHVHSHIHVMLALHRVSLH